MERGHVPMANRPAELFQLEEVGNSLRLPHPNPLPEGEGELGKVGGGNNNYPWFKRLHWALIRGQHGI